MNSASDVMLHPPVNSADHVIGRNGAPVTLVEYGDFQCPYCRSAEPAVMRLLKQFGGELRFVFRNFPLSELHPHAAHAAEAAESVAEHAGEEAYWRMHHLLFEHQHESDEALDDAHLVQYALEAGAEAASVRADLESGILRPRVRSDFVGGVRSSVNGTPTFFINGFRFDGDWAEPRSFEAAVREAAIVGRQEHASGTD